MSLQSWTLEIMVAGKPATFKVAAVTKEEASEKCIAYYRDSDLPSKLHKRVTVTSARVEKWTPAGFGK